MLIIPSILDNPVFYDAELTYKWDEDIFYKWQFEVDNERLNNLFLQLNHKAALGMATALAEWVFWRLQTKGDSIACIATLEPLWAGLIDIHYITDWDYENDGETDNVDGVKRLVLWFMQQIRRNYLRGWYSINGYMDSLAMLARHISPDQEFFDKWFTDCIERAIKLFPVPYDWDNPTEYDEDGKPYHDSSNEPPIPREFFFQSGFDYEKADIPKLLNEFLSQLSWEENDLLTPPDEMIDEGFEGMPYQYKG